LGPQIHLPERGRDAWIIEFKQFFNNCLKKPPFLKKRCIFICKKNNIGRNKDPFSIRSLFLQFCSYQPTLNQFNV